MRRNGHITARTDLPQVLSAVVEAQLDDDRGVDAAYPELLKGSSAELAGSEDH